MLEQLAIYFQRSFPRQLNTLLPSNGDTEIGNFTINF